MKENIKKTLTVFQIFLLLSFHLRGQDKFSLSYPQEAVILGSGSALALISLFIEQQASINPQEIFLLDKNQINLFDRPATYYYSKNLSLTSDVLLIATVSLPLSFLFIEKTKEDIFSIGVMYLETLTLTYGLTNLTKNIVNRYRPYAYNSDVPLSEKLNLDTKQSFFSGHTSAAFASAVFFSTIYSDQISNEKSKTLVWAGSLTLASSVALLRYFSGKHFPTDIIAGAVVGGLIGYGVPKLHQKNSNLSLSFTSSSNLISFKYYLR